MLHIAENTDALIASAAEFFVSQAATSIQEQGRFTVALSGGSSPKKLFTLLASDAWRNRVEWTNVFFFFGDERFVPADDEQSNYRMARETLFTPLGISSQQIFPVNTTLTPEESAKAYEQALLQHFKTGHAFDLIWLGLGDDAHTASLFPHTEVIHEKKALVKEVFVKKVDQYRITFTAPLINAARAVAFLTYGSSKADAVHHIFDDPFQPEEFPAQLVKPASGDVHWFIDREASMKLSARS